MPIIAKYESKDFPQAPEGLQQAVCVDVIDLGLRETKWGMKPKVKIVWQVEDEDTKGQRLQIRGQYTLSLSEKALLRRDLESWRGKKFSDDELQGFDLEKLIGVNCQIQVIHNIVEGGKTYSNAQAIVPIGKGMTKMAPKDYIREQDRPKSGGPGTVGHDEYEGDDSGIPF